MDIDIDDEGVPWWFSTRLNIALLASIGFLTMGMQKEAMNVALTCIINRTAVDMDVWPPFSRDFTGLENVTTIQPRGLSGVACNVTKGILSHNLSMHEFQEGEFAWNEQRQRVLLETYHWGYLASLIPSGYMAERFGSKIVFGLLMLVASVTTGLVPLASGLHYFIMIVLRFLAGVGAGVAFPAYHAILGRWAPQVERTQLATIAFSGYMVGHVASYPLAAFLCKWRFDVGWWGFAGGWSTLFYMLAGLGIIWSIFWMIFIHDSPLTHPRVSNREKRYIILCLAGEADLEVHKDISVPWPTFLTSLPFFAILMSSFICQWGLYTFQVTLPRYMKEVILFDIRNDPIIEGMPYVGLWFLVLCTGLWADKLYGRAVLHKTTVRKMMQSIGTLIPAGAIVAMGFLDCSQVIPAVSIYIVGLSFTGFQYSGYMVNHLDIAPRYAGILIGIGNTIGSFASLLAPVVVDEIVSEKTTEQWQTIFFVCGSLLVFAALCFLVCSSSELQPWASSPEPEPDIPEDPDDEESKMLDHHRGGDHHHKSASPGHHLSHEQGASTFPRRSQSVKVHSGHLRPDHIATLTRAGSLTKSRIPSERAYPGSPQRRSEIPVSNVEYLTPPAGQRYSAMELTGPSNPRRKPEHTEQGNASPAQNRPQSLEQLGHLPHPRKAGPYGTYDRQASKHSKAAAQRKHSDTDSDRTSSTKKDSSSDTKGAQPSLSRTPSKSKSSSSSSASPFNKEFGPDATLLRSPSNKSSSSSRKGSDKRPKEQRERKPNNIPHPTTHRTYEKPDNRDFNLIPLRRTDTSTGSLEEFYDSPESLV